MNTIINSFSKYKKILITGGAGFIGGTLVRKLLIETNSIIYNLDKLSYCSSLESINQLIKDKNIDNKRHILMNIDLESIENTNESLRIADPDIIFHLAAESHVDRSIKDASGFIKSNIIGTYNLLESANKHYKNLEPKRKRFFKLMHISTDEVFGSVEGENKFNEDSKYKPNSPYSASKASSDHLVRAWYETYGLPSIITNCSNNYGPWQYPEKLIPVIILNALEGEAIPIYGDGKNIRDWIHVDDHVKGLIQVSISGEIGETYCLGGSNEINNLDLANLICEKIDKVLKKVNSKKDLIKLTEDRPGHDKRYAINSDKVKEKLNWSPSLNFDEGLEKTINWYMNNKKWCKNIKRSD